MTPTQATTALVTASSTGITATLPGVTAGNTVVAAVSYTDDSGSGGTPTVPTGFTAAKNLASSVLPPFSVAIGVSIFYKVSAGGSETALMPVLNAGTHLYAIMSLTEWPFTASPFDVAAGPGTSQGASTTTASTPTTATLAQSNETCIAGIALLSSVGLANAGISDPPSGYTSLIASQDSAAQTCGELCYKDSGSTAGQSCTWTYTADSNQDGSVQVIATFKQSAAVATIHPLMMLGMGG